MKGLRIIDDEISCLIEDAILYENDSYSKINGDILNGFSVELPEKIDHIIDNGWSELYPSLEKNNDFYRVIAGETSWGGTGFVALKYLKSGLFMWILHLSKMNNPIKVNIEKDIVRLTTDLNFPNGLDFIIPIDKPEKFKIELPAANTQ